MSDKKRRRFGRVRQLPSGRWQARYPGPDGQLRNAPHTFERDKDADQWLSEVETDLRRGDWTDPDAGKIPLGLYAKAWIEERPGLGVRTKELYDGLLRNHIAPFIGEKTLAELSPAMVRRWRKERLDAGTGEVTVAKAYRFLKAVLNTAHDDDKLIKENPCKIKGAGKEESPERPTASIEQALMAADSIQPRYRLMVLLATFASLRYAEMIGLRRQDFDLDAGTVYVRSQTVEPDHGPMFDDDPKSEAGKRPVTVPAFLVPEIRAHLKQYVKPADDARVFLGPKGAQPTRSNFHRIWDKARKAAGIPDMHLHDLRHTGNTLAAETGATLRELMERMGHASTRAALVYLHAREQRGKEIASGIDSMVKKAKRKPRKKVATGKRGTAGTKGHAKGTRKAEEQK